MPKIVGTVGSGMTERGIVAFDLGVPGEIDAIIPAAKTALERTSFQLRSRSLENVARDILAAAGLPTAEDQYYTLGDGGEWRAVPPTSRRRRTILLPELIEKLGYTADSKEGYAARLLCLSGHAKKLLAAGDLDKAMAIAWHIGEVAAEAGMNATWGKEALIGLRQVQAGREGSERRFGSDALKATRRKVYVQVFLEERKSGKPKMRAYKAAAQRFGVSSKTVERAVAHFREDEKD